MSGKPIKAYIVRDDEEDFAVIKFATSNAAARRGGGGELGLEFEDVGSCTRAPWADQYAPGPVPLHAYLTAGWWFECDHCGVRFDKDERNWGDDEDREDALEPVEDAEHAYYCSHTCMMEHWAEKRERTARVVATIEAALVRWPMATGVTAREYCKAWPSRDYEWRAQFTLPRIRYPVSWALGAAEVHVSQCDAEEFRRLYGAAA